MLSYGFAWGKLYLAVAELGMSDGNLLARVRAAYFHLAPLNCTNTPEPTFERLKAIREEFARSTSSSDEDDGTVTLLPLTPQLAAAVASEIISMFDEVAKASGAEMISKAAAAMGDDAVGPTSRRTVLN